VVNIWGLRPPFEIMKTFLRAIAGIILIGSFITLLSLGLNYLQRPNPLENVEKRLDEAQNQQSVLTENEQKLKTESQTKEWEEVDSSQEKIIIPLKKPIK
tara:strand:- start:445 stop:744 length:300 start_codon:yes stop_codon:yes gene_type:complete